VFLYVILEVSRQKGSPRNMLPRTKPVSEAEVSSESFSPVRWTARYITREDTVEGSPALLVFTNLDKAAFHVGTMLADGRDVAVVTASQEEIQKHAFGGDPNGLCIVDPEWTHPPGLPVAVGKLEEWFNTLELDE
jgi:hypothetical protein